MQKAYRRNSRFASLYASLITFAIIAVIYLSVCLIGRMWGDSTGSGPLDYFINFLIAGHLSLAVWALCDFQLNRAKIYKYLRLYEKPLMPRFRVFRNMIVLVTPLLALGAHLIFDGMGANGDQTKIGAGAICISAATATAGCLSRIKINSCTANSTRSKQHSTLCSTVSFWRSKT